MAIQPVDLGRVLMNVQALRAMKQQAGTEQIQQQLMQQRLADMPAQEQRAAAGEQRQATAFDAAQQDEAYKQRLNDLADVHAAAAAVAVDPSQFARVGDVLKDAGYAGDPSDPALKQHMEAIYNATGAEIQAHQAARMRPENTPSNVLEYQYYNSLPPDQQQKFLEMKRTMNPYSLVDVAGGKSTLDKRHGSLQEVTNAQQEAAGQATVAAAKAGATEGATKAADVSFDLPRLEQNVSQAVKAIDELSSHPGLPYITGLYSKVPIIPGTKQADANARAEQLQGKTFLEAYNTLKGSGQISNFEGDKAQAAIGRLNRAQSTPDYQSALADLKSVLVSGLSRAKQQAGGRSSSGATAMPKAGDVMDGYRFKGGDPSSQANWEKQ